MIFINSRHLVFALLLCLLFACQTKDSGIVKPAPVKDLTLNTLPQQNREIRKVITLLEKGYTELAIELINDVLSVNKNHKIANFLKQQLSEPASELFKTKKFINYKVKRGDTLGGIAQKWLGDPMYFVSLAKLNGIKSPTLLESGTIIKIPDTSTSKPVNEDLPRSQQNLTLLEEHLSNKDYLNGLKKIHSLFIIKKHQAKLTEITNQLLTGYAESALTESDLELLINECQTLLDASKDTKQKSIFQTCIQQQQQTLFVRQANLFFNENNYTGSAGKLIQAKDIDRELKVESTILNSVNKLEHGLVDKLHEQAIIHFRNQELDDALKLWVLISQLQPDNELALKYIERTNILINKLNKY